MNNTTKRMIYISIIIFLIGCILFTSLIPFGYGMVLGWIYGSFVSLILLFTNKGYHFFFFSKKRSKNIAFFMTTTYVVVLFIVITLSMLGILLLNSYVEYKKLLKFTKTSDVLNPINLFTFIAGLSCIKIGIIFVGIFDLANIKKKKNEEGAKNETTK